MSSDNTSEKQENNQNQDSEITEKMNDTFIKLHNLYFTATLVSLVELVKKTSIEYCERKNKTSKSHSILQTMCLVTLKHYKKNAPKTNIESEDNDEGSISIGGENNNDAKEEVGSKEVENNEEEERLSERKILVKIYSIMRSNTDLLLERDPELFNLKDNKKVIMTIIPGIDIGLIYKRLSEEDEKRIWRLLSVLFITVTRMVHAISGKKIKKKHKDKIKSTNEALEKQLSEEGINVQQMLFNPFLGLGEDGEDFGIDSLFAGSDPKGKGGADSLLNIESVAQKLGINIDELDKNIREKCKDITDEEINAVTGKITEIFGGDGDENVSDVCGTMIKHVIDDVKEHGIKDMKKTTKNTLKKTEKDLGKKKLKKAAKKMKKFVEKKHKGLANIAGAKGGDMNGLVSNIIQDHITGGDMLSKLGEAFSEKSEKKKNEEENLKTKSKSGGRVNNKKKKNRNRKKR